MISYWSEILSVNSMGVREKPDVKKPPWTYAGARTGHRPQRPIQSNDARTRNMEQGMESITLRATLP
jgi:hypothetical protein